MKIGVVSDTHSYVVPKQMMDDFKSVDLIIHAGDFCSMADLRNFKKIKKVRAVYGNMDGLELRQILPERDLFEIDGVKIGLCHGHGSSGNTLSLVKAEFRKETPDVVIFGHSHQPFNEIIGDVLYFNPGSPNDDMFAPYYSYGVLEVTEQGINGKIIKLKE